jgi:hypothetical protein
MAKNTQYILDAISKEGGNAPVKVLINGVVTLVVAKLAIDQLHKPKEARKPHWVNAQPYLEIETPISHAEPIQPTIVEEISEVELEAYQSKKKKKQIDESYDA